MNKDKIVTVRFSEKERDFLKEEASRIGMGLSTLVRMVMRDYIKERLEGKEDKR